MIIAGTLAGAVNGLLGAGGGMILIPALCLLTNVRDQAVFPASISIILPICIISLFLTKKAETLPWRVMLPLLAGSIIGGILAGVLSKYIPTKWLHRILGIFILWGGIRNLC